MCVLAACAIMHLCVFVPCACVCENECVHACMYACDSVCLYAVCACVYSTVVGRVNWCAHYSYCSSFNA